MRHDDQQNSQLKKLIQSVLDTTQQKTSKYKSPYSFNKKLRQQRQSQTCPQLDILQVGQYLKLLSHQKKYLSPSRYEKISLINESFSIQAQDFRYLFMSCTSANYLKLSSPGYYSLLLSQIPLYPCTLFNSIQKDIPRTLINDHPFQTSLRNVLTAYAIRNPNLLYCQGMNYVVAYLLINNVGEEETFWVMTALIENVLNDDFYKDLTTISITIQIFSDILPMIFPQMAKEMKQVGMDCSLFVVTWYVCLFTKGFINSVSAYLFTRLVLDSRKHSFGFNLLRFSLGVIATILGRDQPFSFKPQFTSFRDNLQIKVLEISLLQIKLGIDYIELNQENYLKLYKHYRSVRESRHTNSLQKELLAKKLTLPKCSLEYPICIYRLQIERKISSIQQVQISKNNYQISSQYFQDYFIQQIVQQDYKGCETIDDCIMPFKNHICQEVNQQNVDLHKILNRRFQLRNQQSFQLSSKNINNHSKSRYSKVDSKFIQLSGFFVVDQKFTFGQQQVQDQDDNDQFQNIQPQNQQGLKPTSSLQHKIKQNMDKNKQTNNKHKQNIHKDESNNNKDNQNSQEFKKLSSDQIFNLAQQLKKNNIEADWIKDQNEYSSNISQRKFNQKINNIKQLQNKQQQIQIKIFQPITQQKAPFTVKDISIINSCSHKQVNIINSNINIQLNIVSNKQVDIKQNQVQQAGFFNKQKLWTLFGQTWKRVLKIKQQQLK